MNITDKERNMFHSAYQTIKNEINEYGKLSDIGIEGLRNEFKLESQIQFIRNKIKVRQLRHVLM